MKKVILTALIFASILVAAPNAQAQELDPKYCYEPRTSPQCTAPKSDDKVTWTYKEVLFNNTQHFALSDYGTRLSIFGRGTLLPYTAMNDEGKLGGHYLSNGNAYAHFRIETWWRTFPTGRLMGQPIGWDAFGRPSEARKRSICASFLGGSANHTEMPECMMVAPIAESQAPGGEGYLGILKNLHATFLDELNWNYVPPNPYAPSGWYLDGYNYTTLVGLKTPKSTPPTTTRPGPGSPADPNNPGNETPATPGDGAVPVPDASVITVRSFRSGQIGGSMAPPNEMQVTVSPLRCANGHLPPCGDQIPTSHVLASAPGQASGTRGPYPVSATLTDLNLTAPRGYAEGRLADGGAFYENRGYQRTHNLYNGPFTASYYFFKATPGNSTYRINAEGASVRVRYHKWRYDMAYTQTCTGTGSMVTGYDRRGRAIWGTYSYTYPCVPNWFLTTWIEEGNAPVSVVYEPAQTFPVQSASVRN